MIGAGRRGCVSVRDVISGLLVVCVSASCVAAPAWAGTRTHHHRSGLAAHLCASHDAVIGTHGHRLRAIGQRHYFAPIGQAMYYRDKSHRCRLGRTAHRHS
ncbi:hypothetical protein HLH32_11960 [Gluconacetobacter liquefaciens]|uniref:Uncharacterized protein n=1 Tax=Gluconacetobacter liquefaciens TaxID=89584 RepID=A0A7W4JLX2_GLULI|nr:hypothetical protein [Gluconacetobacter liquefaciens]